MSSHSQDCMCAKCLTVRRSDDDKARTEGEQRGMRKAWDAMCGCCRYMEIDMRDNAQCLHHGGPDDALATYETCPLLKAVT